MGQKKLWNLVSIKYLIIFLVLISNLKAAEEESFAAYLLKLYDNEYISDNKVILDFKFGYLEHNLGIRASKELPNTPEVGLYYGFSRKVEKLNYTGFYKHSFEYAFLENRDSDLILDDDNLPRLNMWSFGFGFADGFSYSINNNTIIEFVHDGSINWVKTSYPSSEESNNINDYQDKWRFGQNFRTGVNLPLKDYFSLEFRYENNINYNNFKVFPFLVSYSIEIFLQKLPVIFESQLIDKLDKSFPILNWVYKTFISYSIYRFRVENGFWPSKGEKSLYSRGFSLNFKFMF